MHQSCANHGTAITADRVDELGRAGAVTALGITAGAAVSSYLFHCGRGTQCLEGQADVSAYLAGTSGRLERPRGNP